MSIKLMSVAWDLDIPATEKMVLLCLCDFASDGGGNCWPSVNTMAARCSTSGRTVQRAIRSLETRGILDTNQRMGTSSTYRINLRQSVTPDKMSPLTNTTQTPDTVSPKPSRTTNNKNTKRASGIPDGWRPDDFGSQSKCRGIVQAWSQDELETNIEHFTAHHRAKGSKFLDWQDAWKTWVLNSRRWSPKPFAKDGRAANDSGGFLAHKIAQRKARDGP